MAFKEERHCSFCSFIIRKSGPRSRRDTSVGFHAIHCRGLVRNHGDSGIRQWQHFTNAMPPHGVPATPGLDAGAYAKDDPPAA